MQSTELKKGMATERIRTFGLPSKSEPDIHSAHCFVDFFLQCRLQLPGLAYSSGTHF